jgi:murein DD-endopeptidase MepM/ murein hydrolase activator NlpD
MAPLSADKRMASFGGVNRYEALEGYFNTDLLVDYNRKADILAKKLNLQVQSYEAVVRSAKRCEDSLLSIPAILPVSPASYRVSSAFGWREHPITHHRVHHDGLDMAAVEGSKVYSSGNGVVVSISNDVRGYGKQVVVDHGFGYKTRYAHLSKFSVHVGDTVSRGTEIGRVGNTGLSTGPHLHYEVITPKGRQNPINYFVRDLSTKEYKEMINSFSVPE